MKIKHLTDKIVITWEKGKPLYVELQLKGKKSKIDRLQFLSTLNIDDLLEAEVYCYDKDNKRLYRNKQSHW